MVVIGWSITVVIGFFYKCFTLISCKATLIINKLKEVTNWLCKIEVEENMDY